MTAYRSLTEIVVSLKSVTLGVKAVRIRRLVCVKQVSIDKRIGDMREGSGKNERGKANSTCHVLKNKYFRNYQ